MVCRSDRGFSLLELRIVMSIITVIAAIAVPGLLRARMAGNETSAIGSLRVVTSSEAAYAASCGSNGYASSYVVLGTPAPGTTVPFISEDLGMVAVPVKSGYSYTLGNGAGAAAGPNDCNGTATTTAYYATATPLTFGMSGVRSFAVSAHNQIWQARAAAAPAEPFGPPATPIQ